MVEKDLNELIKTSKESLQKVEKRMESLSKKMSGDVNTFWGDLKEEYKEMSGTLTNAAEKIQSEAELQGKLGVMEARDRAEKIKSVSEEFINKVANNAQQELDLAALRSHLAKMQAEDAWKEQEHKLTTLYNESKVEFEKLAKNAGKELNKILLQLTEID
jgi:hypothetical protein